MSKFRVKRDRHTGINRVTIELRNGEIWEAEGATPTAAIKSLYSRAGEKAEELGFPTGKPGGG